MVCKICPARRHCWDKGTCENCEFGKALEGLKKKNENLKEKNIALKGENEKLKRRIDALECPDF